MLLADRGQAFLDDPDAVARVLEQLTRDGNGYDPGPVPEYIDQIPLHTESYRGPPLTDDDYAAPADVARPLSRMLDLSVMAASDPPEFRWHIPGWLSEHPTLLSGAGGVGKSLLALQLAVALASGHAFIGPSRDPLRVLYWPCEDDVPELHRRLHRICRAYGINLTDVSGALHVDARLGLDSALMVSAYGVPTWTSTRTVLREQIHDLDVDVVILDNVAHLYACGENDRAAVTQFVAGIAGLRLDRMVSALLLGHISKGPGSEYSGSTAWENAVRSRWYLGRRMPGEAEPDDGEADASAVRYLARRKANYASSGGSEDAIRMLISDGVMRPELPDDTSDVYGAARKRADENVVIAGIAALAGRGITMSERPGPTYLPRMLRQYELHSGIGHRDLAEAMRRLIVSGRIQRAEVGRDHARRPRFGLVVTEA